VSLIVAVTILLAVVAIESSVFVGVLSWALLRLVRQLDSVCKEVATLADGIKRLQWRMDEHDKLHNYRRRAADAENR
jgi:hypothetical protein